MLKDLIISRVRVEILKLFLLNPAKIFHLREIQRRTNEAMNAIRREMNYLQDKGLAASEPRGNRRYFRFRKDNPLYFDLLALVNKTKGIGRDIIEKRGKLGKIKFAMISGKFIREMGRDKTDVDLLMVGKVVLPEMVQIIKKEEERRGKEINYTVMSEEEFDFRKKRRDPFVLKILYGSRIMIIGDEEEMVK